MTVRFGSSYYPPHHDEPDWERDVALLAASGQTVIRSAELLASWDSIETTPELQDFGWLDRLMDLAEAHGVRLLLGTGSCCPPVWLRAAHPDVVVLDRDGVPYPQGGMWGWACRDAPLVRTETERWVRTLAGRYGSRPGLFGWQVDNEPSHPFVPYAGKTGWYCYCAHTQAAWRAWLRERYAGDLAALSDAWRWDPSNTSFSSWDEVVAPRATPAEWGVVTAWVQWREFACERIADSVAEQARLLRELTPGLPTSTNVFAWSRHDPLGVHIGMDPWRLARAVDAIGYDVYPGIGARFLHEPESVAMHLDYAVSVARAAGVPLWLPELESGPLEGWALGPTYATTPADITRLVVDGLGAGARLLLWQGWREWDCIPIHWGALVDGEGEPTPRLHAATAVARTVAAEGEWLAQVEPAAPDVALLVDSRAAAELAQACAGAYRSLAGWVTGFVTPETVAAGALAGVRLLVMPFGLLLEAATVAVVADWVRAGGHLLTQAKAGWIDERGWSHRRRPGAGLDALLGVREDELEAAAGPVPLVVPGSPRLPGWAGGTVPGAVHRQPLRVVADDAEEVEVLGRFADGRPGLTARPVGDGVAWACGTHLDLGAVRYDAATGGLIAAVARGSGAPPLWSAPPAADGLPRVWCRLAAAGDRALVTATSTADEETVVTVHVGGAAARDLLTGESLPPEAPLRLPVPAGGSRAVVVDGWRRVDAVPRQR